MNRPGFYFCFCPDPNLLNRQIRKLLDSFVPGNWQVNTLWSDDPDLESKLGQALSLVDMMGSAKAVIVRRCEVLKDGFWPSLAPVLKGFKPGIWPFFCLEAQWDKNRPKVPAVLAKQKFYRIAGEKEWIWQFPGITRQNLPRYVRNKAGGLGLAFAPGVQDKLAGILPLDSHGVDQELAKLSLLVNDNERVEPEHLEAVEPKADIDIFALMRMVQQGRSVTDVWQKIFKDQESGRDGMFPFLGLLLREARILWHLTNDESGNIYIHPKDRSEKTALASKLGQEKTARLWTMILEAEMGVKSGTILPDQAMENLTADLYRLFKPG